MSKLPNENSNALFSEGGKPPRRLGARRKSLSGRRAEDNMPKSSISAKGIAGIVLVINSFILVGEAIIDSGCT
jgi:hypothetical protein